MIRLDTIGRMLLGAAIFRSLRRSPKWLLAVVALAGLALMSMGTARAQSCPPVNNTVGSGITHPSAAAALASCKANHALVASSNSGGWHDRYEAACTINVQQQNVTRTLTHIGVWSSCADFASGPDPAKNGAATGWPYVDSCPVDQPLDPVTGECGTPNTCADRPSMPPGGMSNVQNPGSSATVCSSGCTFRALGVTVPYTVDGSLYHTASDGWEPTGEQCTNGSGGASSPAPPDSDGDGTSDGFDPSPNNPGSGGGGDADGEGQSEDGHCGGPDQPACGDPGSGSGNGNTSGGGGNCDAPPTSTGDPILAQIAYQTWATRCAIEGKGTGDGNGDDAQPEWTKGNAPPVPGGDDEGDIAGAKRFGIGIGPGLLDDADIFGGGTCPQFSFQIAGTTISSSDYPQWCNVVAIMRALILIFGAFTALRILMGSE